MKRRLLAATAGLDRGAAASAEDADAVEAAAAALEAAAASSSMPAASPPQPVDERAAGKWRLIFSSTFAGKPGGSQGFSGPPAAGTPLRLGAVYQRIQPTQKRVREAV